jgi:beta-glucosidase
MSKPLTTSTGSSLAIAIALAGLAAPANVQSGPREEADAKAREIVGKLTTDEKVAQLLNVAPAIYRVYGQSACGSKTLLRDYLRGAWGFKG